jgi:hypothetical protein
MAKILTKEEIAKLTPEERIRYFEQINKIQKEEIEILEQQKQQEIKVSETGLSKAKDDAKKELDDQLDLLIKRNLPNEREEQNRRQPLESIAAEAPTEAQDMKPSVGQTDYQLTQGTESLYARLGELQEQQNGLKYKESWSGADKNQLEKLEEEVSKIRGYAVDDGRIMYRLNQVSESMDNIRKYR